MRNTLINLFFFLIMAIIAIWFLSPLVENNDPVTAASNADVQPVTSAQFDHYTGDLTALITDACVVDGLPRIFGMNNYGDSSSGKTITYQRTNGDIAVIYIRQHDFSNGFYVWAMDKIANGVYPS
jgi:hypothetical protein